MGLETLDSFRHILQWDNFCDFLYAPLYTKFILKCVYSKKEEFAPKESKIVPFRVDPFSEGRQK